VNLTHDPIPSERASLNSSFGLDWRTRRNRPRRFRAGCPLSWAPPETGRPL